jgi:hypothetical protein
MDRKINKVEEIQQKINLLQLELNQTQDQDERNKIMKKIQIKQSEKEVQRLKDLMK